LKRKRDWIRFKTIPCGLTLGHRLRDTSPGQGRKTTGNAKETGRNPSPFRPAAQSFFRGKKEKTDRKTKTVIDRLKSI
jgi:hypothetical protein